MPISIISECIKLFNLPVVICFLKPAGSDFGSSIVQVNLLQPNFFVFLKDHPNLCLINLLATRLLDFN